MSREYSITTVIKSQKKITISDILTSGKKLGCIYRNYLPGRYNISGKSLSISESITSLKMNYEENNFYCITTEYKGTYFNLIFAELITENEARIMFTSLSSLWSRNYIGEQETLDIHRYIRLMLDLVNNFKISELIVECD